MNDILRSLIKWTEENGIIPEIYFQAISGGICEVNNFCGNCGALMSSKSNTDKFYDFSQILISDIRFILSNSISDEEKLKHIKEVTEKYARGDKE